MLREAAARIVVLNQRQKVHPKVRQQPVKNTHSHYFEKDNLENTPRRGVRGREGAAPGRFNSPRQWTRNKRVYLM